MLAEYLRRYCGIIAEYAEFLRLSSGAFFLYLPLHRLSEQTPRVEVVYSLRWVMHMIYTFLSSVFIALFLVVGTLALMGFFEMMRKNMPLTWLCYQHVVVLALIAVLCFICACIFGAQIPYYYAA